MARGGLIAGKGVIWSARQLLRWDTALALTGANSTCDSHDSYGLCIDSQGNVWNTSLFGDVIRKFAKNGALVATFSHGNNGAQGCVVGQDDDVWVAIWTGAGRGFCSGADVGRGPGATRPDPDLNQLLDETSWVSRQGEALYGIDKPIIAAVNGVAAGAGFSLALCCAVRIGI